MELKLKIFATILVRIKKYLFFVVGIMKDKMGAVSIEELVD